MGRGKEIIVREIGVERKGRKRDLSEKRDMKRGTSWQKGEKNGER